MKALLMRKADAKIQNKHGDNALMASVSKGYWDIALNLIENMSVESLNAQNLEGQTALILCSLFGQNVVTFELMRKGANPDIIDRYGKDAKNWAYLSIHPNRKQYETILKLLLNGRLDYTYEHHLLPSLVVKMETNKN